MGFMSRKVLPVCGHMCVCCPALRSRSRQPVKRYKKLLVGIFPKSPDGSPNERKVLQLCEYAAKNPFRIPKIVEHLEQRIHKELKNEHTGVITIVMDAYNKLLCLCKQQMPYFAVSLLNVVEILQNTKRDDLQILGCEVFTRFIYSQVDGIYAHNIETLVPKVCMMAREVGDGHSKRCLRASSLQCISSMVWFMAEFSQFFISFDDIVFATLDNYEPDAHLLGAERGEPHHNWVDEVVRSEARGATLSVSSCDKIIRPRPEMRNPSLLTREEIETPKVWAQICVQKMSELVKISATVRWVLDPMFIYFDIRRHWDPQRGLAIAVLSDLFYYTEGSGNEQSILSAIIRHLDHKNVSHDPRVKSDIIRIVALLARQFRSATIVVETGVVNDLCRHLRKNFQASVALTGDQETNLSILLQNSIEDCLLEMAKGVHDAQVLFDMITLTLEKSTAVGVASRETFASMLVLARIISLLSSCGHSQQVFPESLLLQLLKIMIHPDNDARLVAHQIFSVLLIPTYKYPKRDYHTCEPKRSPPVFASAVALLEKLRREKEAVKVEKHEDRDAQDHKRKECLREEWVQQWTQKYSPNFCKLNSTIDGTTGSTASAVTELNIVKLSEDQTSQLLSAFWIQARLPDNMPSNFEALSHSFNLTLLSSHLRNSSDDVVHFFQLSLSLRNISLDPDYDALPPSCRRSLFVLATAMMMSTAVIYHIPGLYDILKSSVSYDVDPYVGIDDDQQLYVKSQADIKEYRSGIYNQVSLYVLSGLREHVHASDKIILDVLVQSLSGIVQLDKDDLAEQLLQTFSPDSSFLLAPHSWCEGNLQMFSIPVESLSFDGDFLTNGTVDDETISEASVPDLSHFNPQVPSSHSLCHVIGAGELLESALEKAGKVAGTAVPTLPLPYSAITSQCESLGACTRKKLSIWLDHDPKPAGKILFTFPGDGLSVIKKMSGDSGPGLDDGGLSTEAWLTTRLPPSSAYDNFLRAVNRKRAPLLSARESVIEAD